MGLAMEANEHDAHPSGDDLAIYVSDPGLSGVLSRALPSLSRRLSMCPRSPGEFLRAVASEPPATKTFLVEVSDLEGEELLAVLALRYPRNATIALVPDRNEQRVLKLLAMGASEVVATSTIDGVGADEVLSEAVGQARARRQYQLNSARLLEQEDDHWSSAGAQLGESKPNANTNDPAGPGSPGRLGFGV